LNQISSLAAGKYIARMDADDLMHPSRIERQVDFLDHHPEIDVVGTGAYSIDNNYRVVGVRKPCEISNIPLNILKQNVFIHPTIMGKTDWFKCNKYDSSFDRGEDHELWCRTYLNSKFAILNEPLYFYREIDVFNFNNYYKSRCAEIRIIRRYGPNMVGKIMTHFLIARVLVKLIIYKLANQFGLEYLLIRKRYNELCSIKRAELQEIITKIMRINVPGLVQNEELEI
jgi:hypothetical protein